MRFEFNLTIILIKSLIIFFSLLPLYGLTQHVSQKSVSSSGVQFIKTIELRTSGQGGVFEQQSKAYMGEKESKVDYPESNVLEGIAKIERAGILEFKFAQLLDAEVEELKQFELYAFINQWLNTPYLFGGSSKDGIDCSGFTCELMKVVFGTALPHSAKGQYHSVDKIDKEELQEGDLVFFNTRGGVSHVGVYLKNNFFVHSSTREGVIISSLDEKYYHRKFIGAGRISLFETSIIND